MILVDSSVWVDYLRGTPTPQADKLDALLGTGSAHLVKVAPLVF